MVRLWASQKFFHASLRLAEDSTEQFVSAPIAIRSNMEEFDSIKAVRLDMDSRKSSSWPEVGA